MDDIGADDDDDVDDDEDMPRNKRRHDGKLKQDLVTGSVCPSFFSLPHGCSHTCSWTTAVTATFPSHSLLYLCTLVDNLAAAQVYRYPMSAACRATSTDGTNSHSDTRARHRTTQTTPTADHTPITGIAAAHLAVAVAANTDTTRTLLHTITAVPINRSSPSPPTLTSHPPPSFIPLQADFPRGSVPSRGAGSGGGGFGIPTRSASSNSYDTPVYGNNSMLRNQPPGSSQASGPGSGGGGNGDLFAAFLDADEQSRHPPPSQQGPNFVGLDWPVHGSGGGASSAPSGPSSSGE